MTEKENAAPGWHPDTAEDAFDFQLPNDDSADAAAGAGAFPFDWNGTDRFRSRLEAWGEEATEPYEVRLLRHKAKTLYKRLIDDLYPAQPRDHRTIRMVERQILGILRQLGEL